MNADLLSRCLGRDRQWRGPCVVILDAEANVQASGADAIVHSGAKVYAPRIISGRVHADFVCLLADENSILIVQSHRIRQASGEDLQQDNLLIVSLAHVAAIEFSDLSPLKALGVGPPR
jgi:hypothetical protein